MSILFRLIISIFIGFAFVLQSIAAEDEKLRFDEIAFVTAKAEDIEIKANTEVNCFLFEIDSTSNYKDSLQKMIKSLKSLEENKRPQLNIVITGNYNNEQVKSFLANSFTNRIEYYDSKKSGDSISHSTKTIRCFLSNSLVHLSDSTRTEQPYNGRYLSNPENKLIIFDTEGIQKDSLHQTCIHFWKSTGRVPNFVLCNTDNLSEGKETIQKLNDSRRIRGHVTFEGKTLNEIYWKQLPGTVTQGKFSFPIIDYSLVLSPYKNGYRITPGEVIHHTHMKDIVRPFIAYNTDYKDQLLYHFKFDHNTNNEVDPEFTQIIANSNQWGKDNTRGKTVLFNSPNSFIDYTKPNGLNFNTPISVSAWLKPNKHNNFMGIIGIGTSFSFKLRNGLPDFTTAQIKDHISETVLPINKWTHVGFVFNPGGTVDFYINGEKEKSMEASDIQDSQQSLIIGNNIWGEQYFGLIDELMVWDRGLSDNEFKQLYNTQLHPASRSKAWFLLILPLLLLLFFLRFKRKNIKKPLGSEKVKVAHVQTVNPIKAENKIELFGRFNVESEQSGNITTQFSPLLKQLLAFFVIKMVFSENQGVSTKELTDTFWPGFTKEQAKDNRGTNIKKLRKLLKKIPGVELVFRDKKWYLETTNSTEIDLFNYQLLINQLQQSSKQTTIESLLALLNKGNILQETDISWLDTYKNRMTEDVTRIMFDIYHSDNTTAIKTEVAKTMLLFDNLNEEALKLLILQLNENGNHGLAKQTFEEFIKRYEKLYSDKFPVDFNDLLKSEIN